MGEHGRQPGGGFEQLGGFAVDNLHIAVFGGVRIIAVHQLQHFAFGDDVGGIAQDIHDFHVIQLGHHLKGAGVEKIADQHAGGIAEQCVGGIPASTQIRLVDHIVMQQGGGMNEFDDGREGDMGLVFIAEGTGRQHGKLGAHTLAAGTDDIEAQLIDQGHIRLQP